jgi:Na+/phosphate symporter
MKNCYKKLEELIEDVILADVEDSIDEIYGVIAKDKKANDELQAELEELHDLRNELKDILADIQEGELDKDECAEIYEELFDMISEDEE